MHIINKHLKKEVNLTCINIIRNLPGVKEIINSCSAFGRTWGKTGSKLHGSHIAFINPEEIVLLIQDKKSGDIRFINFVKVEQTLLGNEIAAELDKNKIAYAIE